MALWHAEGLAPGPGLCDGDRPDAGLVDATGAERLWLLVGQPDPERLETFRRKVPELGLLLFASDWRRWWQAREAQIPQLPGLSVAAADGGLCARLVPRLDQRRLQWEMTVSEARIYIGAGDWQEESDLVQLRGERGRIS